MHAFDPYGPCKMHGDGRIWLCIVRPPPSPRLCRSHWSTMAPMSLCSAAHEGWMMLGAKPHTVTLMWWNWFSKPSSHPEKAAWRVSGRLTEVTQFWHCWCPRFSSSLVSLLVVWIGFRSMVWRLCLLACGMLNPVLWDEGLGGSIEAAYEPNSQATNTTQLNTTVLSPPRS